MLRPVLIALPGDAVTTKSCRPDELRSLFLFEKLTDAQLDWLCQRGRIEVFPAGPVYTEGDPARSFYVLLEGTVVLSRRVGADDVELGRTSQRGVYAGAWEAYLGAPAAHVYNSSMRVTEPSRFFVLDAEVFATLMQEWFPMAVHLLEGAFFGARSMYELTGQRERLLALGSLSSGLTHELNNPAAATVRAAATLRDRIGDMRRQLSRDHGRAGPQGHPGDADRAAGRGRCAGAEDAGPVAAGGVGPGGCHHWLAGLPRAARQLAAGPGFCGRRAGCLLAGACRGGGRRRAAGGGAAVAG